MKPKKLQARVRHVRCPECGQLWLAPRDLAADVGKGVAAFDWPYKLCPHCYNHLNGGQKDATPERR